jgi:hypothetical protein
VIQGGHLAPLDFMGVLVGWKMLLKLIVMSFISLRKEGCKRESSSQCIAYVLENLTLVIC